PREVVRFLSVFIAATERRPHAGLCQDAVGGGVRRRAYFERLTSSQRAWPAMLSARPSPIRVVKGGPPRFAERGGAPCLLRAAAAGDRGVDGRGLAAVASLVHAPEGVLDIAHPDPAQGLRLPQARAARGDRQLAQIALAAQQDVGQQPGAEVGGGDAATRVA